MSAPERGGRAACARAIKDRIERMHTCEHNAVAAFGCVCLQCTMHTAIAEEVLRNDNDIHIYIRTFTAQTSAVAAQASNIHEN